MSFATALPSASCTSHEHHVRALRGQQPRGLLAGAARGARHDRDLPLDASHFHSSYAAGSAGATPPGTRIRTQARSSCGGALS